MVVAVVLLQVLLAMRVPTRATTALLLQLKTVLVLMTIVVVVAMAVVWA